jgi:hypothetical protein
MSKRLLIWLVALLGLLTTGAAAQEMILGWEGGPSNGYGFVMPVFSIPKDGSQSFVIRPAGSYLYYNFRELGGFTKVTSPVRPWEWGTACERKS